MSKQQRSPSTGQCTSLDHVYPRTKFGQRCYCGARTWGGKTAGKKSSKAPEKVVDSSPATVIEFPQPPVGPATLTSPASEPATKEKPVQITLKGTGKNGKRASYEGSAKAIYIDLVNFEGGVAPQTLEIPGLVAAKPKLTKEERKALRASQPKPTKAERAQKLRERLARLEAAAAKEGAAAL